MGTFRGRLLAAFVGVALGATIILALFVRTRTEQEIEEYDEQTDQLQITRMEHWLIGYYTSAGGWDGVEPFVEEMGVLYGQHVIVADREGTEVATSRPFHDPAGDKIAGEPVGEVWEAVPLYTFIGDEYIGTLFIATAPTVQTTLRRGLLDSLTVVVIIGALLAALFAIPLSAIFTRTLSKPLRALAESAARAGSGDLSVRVPESGMRELRTLSQSFNAMTANLEEAAALRRTLVADTAHEVRTPLSNIRGFIEALHDGLVDAETAIRAIDEESALLGTLADDLQELAQADAGALRLDRKAHQPYTLLKPPVARFRTLASERGITVSLECPHDLPEVDVDMQRVTQIVTNLLSNALRYCDSAGEVSVDATRLEDDPFVLVTVADTGPGIPSSEIEHIFERFYRVDPSRSRATGGSGLGLSIARKLVELHGGSIRAENRSTGAAFEFTLPMHESNTTVGETKDSPSGI